MKIPGSLRGQLAASAAILVLLIVALSGLVIVLTIDARERAVLDTTLDTRLSRVGEDLGKIVDDEHTSGSDLGPDTYGGLLAGSDSLVRLVLDGTVVAQRGAIPDELPAAPVGDGYSTVTIDGQPWRSLTTTDASSGLRIQVLESLAPVQQRLEANAWLIIAVTAVATVVALLGGWLVARLVLHPLERLTRGASTIRAERDVTYRVPEVSSPREVAELSDTLNGMLDRLHRGMQSTRRFTADAGHELRTPLSTIGAYLEILSRNPGLPDDQRGDILASATAEHQRMVDLLDGLQALARGDAEALPDRDEVDPVDLAEEAIRRARRRHPSAVFEFDNDARGDRQISGWRDGLRLAVDNLLTNAAVHGRPDGSVVLTLSATVDAVTIAVEDDGPGIPEDLRGPLRGRFVRGGNPDAPGSGLGLALVDQQAALHGGSLELNESATGGLRARIVLPRR